MRFIFVLLLLSYISLAGTLTAIDVQGEVRNLSQSDTGKTFLHSGNEISTPAILTTSHSGFLQCSFHEQHLFLFPLSKVRISSTDSSFQIILYDGELYISGDKKSTVIGGGITVTPLGSTHIIADSSGLTASTINGGSIIYSSKDMRGEIVPKGYTVSYRHGKRERMFHSYSDSLLICPQLSCEFKKRYQCKECPFSQDIFAQNGEEIFTMQEQLIVHPFTIEASNSFPLTSEIVSSAIAFADTLKQFNPVKAEKLLFRELADSVKSNSVAYYILDGKVYPDRNNTNRAHCEINLFSLRESRYLFKETYTFYLLDDFTTGLVTPAPDLANRIAERLLKSIKEINYIDTKDTPTEITDTNNDTTPTN